MGLLLVQFVQNSPCNQKKVFWALNSTCVHHILQNLMPCWVKHIILPIYFSDFKKKKGGNSHKFCQAHDLFRITGILTQISCQIISHIWQIAKIIIGMKQFLPKAYPINKKHLAIEVFQFQNKITSPVAKFSNYISLYDIATTPVIQ